MTHRDAAYWINRLQLQKHPEGGFFREFYRAEESLAPGALPARFNGPRAFSTAIYFLLPGREVSRFHRLRADEMWHYYAGSSLAVHILGPAGEYAVRRLGPDPERDESFQVLIRAGCWFGATVNDSQSYTLAGCTVAPGFDYADFELANRSALLAQYPEHGQIVRSLTP